MIRYCALLFGLIIVCLGLLGLAAPDAFMIALRFFQASHRVYVAGAIRVLIGAVFFLAASDSRWPTAMRITGIAVAILGLLTPISTHPLPSVAWGWWSENFVRPWALTTMSVGLFVVAAVAPPRRFED
jgi:hypothetical protein